MQRQSLRTPVAQPMAEVSSVPGPMPDLAFLIVEIRAFSKWWMMRPEPTVAHVHGCAFPDICEVLPDRV